MVKATRKRAAARTRSTPSSADPIDIAMESGGEGPARDVLLGQARLIRAQIFSERLGIGLKLLTGLAGLAAAFGVAVMVWAASRADGLVIHAFSVPPDLATKGLTGEVVAARVLDRLARMSREANVPEPPGRFDTDWASQISVEIPQTGVSISELQRLLRGWLGRETHLRGEVVRNGQDLQVLARVGNEATTPSAGAEADLDAMLDRVAEGVFARTQPNRYGQWLVGRGRGLEAIPVYDDVISTGSEPLMAWAYAGRGGALMATNPVAAREALWSAIRLDPKGRTQVRTLLPVVEGWLGHSEQALSIARSTAVLNQRDRTRLLEFRRQRAIHDPALVAEALGDFAAARDGYAALMEHDLLGSPYTYRPTRVQFVHALARLHEARATIEGADAYRASRPTLNPRETAVLLEARRIAAVSVEDWQGALEISNLAPLMPDGSRRTGQPTISILVVPPLLRLGRIDEARTVVAATPFDCQPCVIARGQVAAAMGDFKTADHWFGEAVRLAPSLPFAATAWGDVLLHRGDADGAVAKAKLAYARSPRYPDNLELWGEALLHKGDAAAAAAKFAETDKLAPRWGRNHLMWGEALAKQGKTVEARAQWMAAQAMDLSRADQAEATARLAPDASLR